MQFLADENVDRQIVERLRNGGDEVFYVAEMAPGISDDSVLNSSNVVNAILLTADKDFGEMIFRQKKIATGIVLIRLAGISPDRKAEIVFAAIAQHRAELHDAFTVIAPGVVRVRRKFEL